MSSMGTGLRMLRPSMSCKRGQFRKEASIICCSKAFYSSDSFELRLLAIGFAALLIVISGEAMLLEKMELVTWLSGYAFLVIY